MDLDDECQVIHELSVVKCWFCYLNILEFKHDSYLFADVTGSFMSFINAIPVGHVIDQGRKIYSGRHPRLTKENVTEMLRADVIFFLYEVPCIFLHYINVDEVSWITLKKVLQSAMELLQIATASFITKCDGLLLQIATAFLLQSATRFITNCDRYYNCLLYTSDAADE